jgi:hypothetical protein
MPVPYTFASATAAIPLSNLDSNFATAVTIGNTAVQLGNTITTLNNVTINASTLSSCNIAGGGANGVVYINTSNVATANASNLSYNGNNFLVNTSTPPSGTSGTFAVKGYSNNEAGLQLQSSGSGNGGVLLATSNNALRFYTYTGTIGSESYSQAFNVTSGGNIQFQTSNAGIIFDNSSASTNSTLNDYETGTWTPTDASGAGLTLSITSASYTKIGRLVYVFAYVNYPSTSNSASAVIGGLPFTQLGSNSYSAGVARSPNLSGTLLGQINNAGTSIVLQSGGSSLPTNANLSNNYVVLTIVYEANF